MSVAWFLSDCNRLEISAVNNVLVPLSGWNDNCSQRCADGLVTTTHLATRVCIRLKWQYTRILMTKKAVAACWVDNYTPAQRSWRGGILDSPCPSVCPSVRPSVCRRHGFRSISQVSFGISISNFICMLMVAIGRSLLIFSVVTFKMASWRPYWIFWFPDSNFSLALNINFKLQRHNTYVYG